MKKILKIDYAVGFFLVLLITIFVFKQIENREIKENGITGVAKVLKVEKVYNQGLFIEYQYVYNGIIYNNRKSVSSYDEGRKYLSKHYEIKFSKENPKKSIINLN